MCRNRSPHAGWSMKTLWKSSAVAWDVKMLLDTHSWDWKHPQNTYQRNFIAALFTIVKKWKLKTSINWWMNEVWYIHTMEYYSPKKGEVLVTCYNGETSKRSQSQKGPTFHDSMCMKCPGQVNSATEDESRAKQKEWTDCQRGLGFSRVMKGLWIRLWWLHNLVNVLKCRTL
jgi:hypothetical protein